MVIIHYSHLDVINFSVRLDEILVGYSVHNNQEDVLLRVLMS